MMRNFSLQIKLFILVAFPMLALVVGSSYLMNDRYQQSFRTKQFADSFELVVFVGALIHEMQIERGLSSGFVASKGLRFSEALNSQRLQTDQQLQNFDHFFKRNALDDFLASQLTSLIKPISEIQSFRTQVDKLQYDHNQVIEKYTVINTLLIAKIPVVATLAPSTQLLDMVNSYESFIKAKELAGIERALGAVASSKGQFSADVYRYFNRLVIEQKFLIRDFKNKVPEQGWLYYQRLVKQPIMQNVEKMREQMLVKGASTIKAKNFYKIIRALGYGGAIHNFKNYLLRRDDKSKQAFLSHYRQLQDALGDYRSNTQLSESEKRALSVVEQTIKAYRMQFDHLQKQTNLSTEISELDKAVKIDDGPAIRAFDQLHALTENTLFEISPEVWFSGMTRKIDLLYEFELKLSELVIGHSKHLSKNSLLQAWTYPLVLLVIISLVLLFGFLISRSIIEPINNLLIATAKLAEGHRETRLEIVGRDELASMGIAFNHMAYQAQAQYQQVQDSLQQLQVTQEQLVKTQTMASLANMITGIAHEVNTPLGVTITGITHAQSLHSEFNDLMQNGHVSGRDIKCYVQENTEITALIFTSLQKIRALMERLKQLNIAEYELKTERVNLHQQLKLGAECFSDAFAQDDHCFELQVEEDLYFRLSPSVLLQLESILIRNSLRHGFYKKREGHICLKATVEYDELLLEYKDDGQGIGAELLPKLFDPFYTTQRGQGHVGLGMHVLYNLVTQVHGGSVLCRSQPGAGVELEIRLRAKPATLK